MIQESATADRNNEVLQQSAASDDEAMPLALMILIPILSSGLILVILAVVCIRRQTTSVASSLTASPLVKTNDANHVNVQRSDHLLRQQRPITQQANSLQTSLKRLSSLHFYAKPWAINASLDQVNVHEQPEDDLESQDEGTW